MIVIVGAGPRGLAIALELLYKGHKILMVDPYPMSSWQYVVPDLVMRSPITFDLVLGSPYLQQYSLATFLGLPYPDCSSQASVEANKTPVMRQTFLDYCGYILGVLEPYIVRAKAVSLNATQVHLDTGQVLDADAVILAIGVMRQPKLPHLPGRRLISPIDALTKRCPKGPLAVLGSGQSSAEMACFLADTNKVYWVHRPPLKVHPYPAPSYSEWGPKSALGDYYSSLSTDQARSLYLAKVKQWQPSITPSIWDKALHYQSLDQLVLCSDIPDDVQYVIPCVGNRAVLPPLLKGQPLSPILPHLPNVGSGFRLSNGVYVSGLLATAYDGPRQASLISAANTARRIAEAL